MSETPQPDNQNSGVSAVIGILTLCVAGYLIWQGIKLFLI